VSQLLVVVTWQLNISRGHLYSLLDIFPVTLFIIRRLFTCIATTVLSVDYIITYLGIDSSAIMRRCDIIVVINREWSWECPHLLEAVVIPRDRLTLSGLDYSGLSQ
jgi:hypothetical protein